jgi:hypothetical protein
MFMAVRDSLLLEIQFAHIIETIRREKDGLSRRVTELKRKAQPSSVAQAELRSLETLYEVLNTAKNEFIEGRRHRELIFINQVLGAVKHAESELKGSWLTILSRIVSWLISVVTLYIAPYISKRSATGLFSNRIDMLNKIDVLKEKLSKKLVELIGEQTSGMHSATVLHFEKNDTIKWQLGIIDKGSEDYMIGVIMGDANQQQVFIRCDQDLSRGMFASFKYQYNLIGLPAPNTYEEDNFKHLKLQPNMFVFIKSTNQYMDFSSWLLTMPPSDRIELCRRLIKTWWFSVNYFVFQGNSRVISESNCAAMYAIFNQLTQHANYLNEHQFIELLYDSSVQISFGQPMECRQNTHQQFSNQTSKLFGEDIMITLKRGEQAEEYYIAPANFKQYIQAGCKVTEDGLRRVSRMDHRGEKPDSLTNNPSTDMYPGLFYIDKNPFIINWGDTNPIIVSGVSLTTEDVLKAVSEREEGRVPLLPANPVSQPLNATSSGVVLKPQPDRENMIDSSRNGLGHSIFFAAYDRQFSIILDKEGKEPEEIYALAFKICVEYTSPKGKEYSPKGWEGMVNANIWSAVRAQHLIDGKTTFNEETVHMYIGPTLSTWFAVIRLPLMSYETYLKVSANLFNDLRTNSFSKRIPLLKKIYPELQDKTTFPWLLPTKHDQVARPASAGSVAAHGMFRPDANVGSVANEEEEVVNCMKVWHLSLV